MRSFDQFLAVLNEIPDPRRAEGKLYKLPYILLFSVLALVTGWIWQSPNSEFCRASASIGASPTSKP